jgi:hypothetical protein
MLRVPLARVGLAVRVASSATLALNAGESFRRGLLLMLSLLVSPLFADRSQDRVFTHRRVQISGATSVVQRRNKSGGGGTRQQECSNRQGVSGP